MPPQKKFEALVSRSAFKRWLPSHTTRMRQEAAERWRKLARLSTDCPDPNPAWLVIGWRRRRRPGLGMDCSDSCVQMMEAPERTQERRGATTTAKHSCCPGQFLPTLPTVTEGGKLEGRNKSTNDTQRTVVLKAHVAARTVCNWILPIISGLPRPVCGPAFSRSSGTRHKNIKR